MSERRELVELVREGSVTIAAMSGRFGVSRKTIYKWMKRYELQGTSGLAGWHCDNTHHHPWH